jgi:hypothetical protein
MKEHKEIDKDVGAGLVSALKSCKVDIHRKRRTINGQKSTN